MRTELYLDAAKLGRMCPRCGAVYPVDSDQHRHGIEVSLVRLPDLDDEPKLVCDFGIHGERAVCHQTTDSEGRIRRFESWFSPEKVSMAEQHWNQLLLYAVSLKDLGN